MKALTPSAKSSERNAASRSACSSASSAGSSGGISACSTRLLPRSESGESAAISRRQRDGALGHVVDDLVDEAPGERLRRVDRPRREEQLARAGGADRVDEAPQAGVRVDDAEARRRHPERAPRRADAQVAGQRELQPAAERVAGQRGDDRHRHGVQRGERRLERVRQQLGGLLGQVLRREVADVVAGREDVALAGEHHAARVERRQRLAPARRARRGRARCAWPGWRSSAARRRPRARRGRPSPPTTARRGCRPP